MISVNDKNEASIDQYRIRNNASAGDCKCTGQHRYGRVYVQPIFGNVAVNVASLLCMDEWLVQLSDPQDHCRCARAPKKYGEHKIVVRIPSTRKRDDCLAERDWPAMT